MGYCRLFRRQRVARCRLCASSTEDDTPAPGPGARPTAPGMLGVSLCYSHLPVLQQPQSAVHCNLIDNVTVTRNCAIFLPPASAAARQRVSRFLFRCLCCTPEKPATFLFLINLRNDSVAQYTINISITFRVDMIIGHNELKRPIAIIRKMSDHQKTNKLTRP